MNSMGHYADMVDYQRGSNDALHTRTVDYARTERKTKRPMATLKTSKASLINRVRYYCRRNIGALLGCAWMGAVVVTLAYIGFLVVTRD